MECPPDNARPKKTRKLRKLNKVEYVFLPEAETRKRRDLPRDNSGRFCSKIKKETDSSDGGSNTKSNDQSKSKRPKTRRKPSTKSSKKAKLQHGQNSNLAASTSRDSDPWQAITPNNILGNTDVVSSHQEQIYSQNATQSGAQVHPSPSTSSATPNNVTAEIPSDVIEVLKNKILKELADGILILLSQGRGKQH